MILEYHRSVKRSALASARLIVRHFSFFVSFLLTEYYSNFPDYPPNSCQQPDPSIALVEKHSSHPLLFETRVSESAVSIGESKE